MKNPINFINFCEDLKNLYTINGELKPFLKECYNENTGEFDLDILLSDKFKFVYEMGEDSHYFYEILNFYVKMSKYLEDEIRIYQIKSEDIFKKQIILDKIFEVVFVFLRFKISGKTFLEN